MASSKDDNNDEEPTKQQLPAKPDEASEQSLVRMPSISKWFRSTSLDLFRSTDGNDSVAGILRDEALKSEVSNFDPKMLASMNIQFPPPLSQVVAAKQQCSTSTTSQDSFLQKILCSYDGGSVNSGQVAAAVAAAKEVTPPALTASAEDDAAKLPAKKPSAPLLPKEASLARNTSTTSSVSQDSISISNSNSILHKVVGSARTAISKLCTSGDWAPDLTAHEPVNVNEVFQTKNSQDSGPQAPPLKTAVALPHEELSVARKMANLANDIAAAQPPRKRRKKTDWNADFMQQMAASTATMPPAPAAVLNSTTTATATVAVPAAAASLKNPTLPTAASVTASVAATAAVQPAKQSRKRKAAADAATVVYVIPTEHDVLMGRGGRTNNHPGNKLYLQAKDAMQARYMAASKTNKTPISQELADKVHAWGGRFLKLVEDDSKNGNAKWVEVDAVTARKKCSQTLREINTPEVRKAKRTKYIKS